MLNVSRKRIRIIKRCGYILFVMISMRLLYLQTYKQGTYYDKALDLWERSFPIAQKRGVIVDRNMQVLAYNLNVMSVMVVPNQIDNKEETAKILSEILDCDYSTLLALLSKHVSTQKLNPMGKLLSEKEEASIVAANLDGVYLIEDAKRYYPYGNYLAQVLGFCGIDNQGLSGLELKHEANLKAKGGSLDIPFDALGNKIDILEESYNSSGQGLNVMLTIDSTIQSVLEREMNNLMIEYKPSSSWALAMNPNTGEILGMVSKPDFDPNNYQNYDIETINRNLPIFNSYEPGSTFKIITFSVGLDLKAFDMHKDTYYDRGYEMVSGARIKSWKAGGHGQQTFLEVLQNSSNPGFVEISRRIGKDKLYEYIMNYGFGKKTNVDLVGESSGIMFSYDKMGELESATTAFGQGISITAIQLVSAISASINGGYLYQPFITKALLDPITNEVLESTKPKLIRQVISNDTSYKMRYALESVIAKGGGKSAYMEGYKIGGKTGTAQKVKDGQYMENEYILSFCGVAPIDDPQIVVYMAIDNPKSTIQYGGTVVAPIVKRCFEDILPYLNIKKTNDQMPKTALWNDVLKFKVDNYIGKTKKEVKGGHFNIVYQGDGIEVIAQLPRAGEVLEEGKSIWLILGDDEVK